MMNKKKEYNKVYYQNNKQRLNKLQLERDKIRRLDPEYRKKKNEYCKEWRKLNLDQIRVREKKYQLENKGKAKEYWLKNKHRFIKKRKEYSQMRQLKYKKMVIEAYGGECECCGEKEIDFLTIDHIAETGAEERKKDPNMIGVNLYRRLVSEKFPRAFRLLCWNCNIARSKNGNLGVCPHEWRRLVNEDLGR